ncbi:MAG: elongation factor P [Alphaproteobacteria bacterium]|nr:elongation factor P [Alphaproteobacteria bacterium]
MKIKGNQIKVGNVIEHKGSLWRAMKTEHTQPGKGGAYLQVELRNLLDGSKLNERFRASEDVERARLEQRPYQFLYADADMYTFMNSETYDQINLQADMIGAQSGFLQDGMEVEIEFHGDTPIGVKLPDSVVLEVTETEPVIKGQTAANSYKPALLDNGMRVNVPPFIDIGEKIKVNTETQEYMERVK